MKLKTIKLFIAVLCVLLLGVGNAYAETLWVAAGTNDDNRFDYAEYSTNSYITLPTQGTISNKSVGTLYYNSTEHKLTFNNVHRTSATTSVYFFSTKADAEPLTVELIGDNELNVDLNTPIGDPEFFAKNIKIVGSGSLKVCLKPKSYTHSVKGAKVIDMEGTGIVEIYMYEVRDDDSYAALEVNLQEGMMLLNSNFRVSTMNEENMISHVFRANGGLHYKLSDDNIKAQCIHIEPLKKYNLYVANQQVNWINMTDILGDGHVKYNPLKNQLELENANINYEFNGNEEKHGVIMYAASGGQEPHTTGVDPSTFKVKLEGENKITGVVNSSLINFHGINYGCTFLGSGSLRMDLSANVAATSGVFGFGTTPSNTKPVTLDSSFTGWVSASCSNVGTNPASVFNGAAKQLSLPDGIHYFVACGDNLPVVARTLAATHENLNVAHVNFGYKGASAAPTATITNQSRLTENVYVGKTLADNTCGLSVTGGQAPFYYTATGLQAGLSINSETGYVSGTYAKANIPNRLSNNTTLTATDIQGRQASVEVAKQAVVQKLTLVDSSDSGMLTLEPKWAEGVAIESLDLSEKVTGGSKPYKYTVQTNLSNLGFTDLPAGVTLDSNTGVISGTPTVHKSYKCAILVEDALGQKVGITVQGNVAVNYGFSVTGVPVTGLNRNNIPVSGKTSGTLSYDPATETLVFDNVRAYTTSASTPYFVDSKISKINVVGDNRISYLGSSISGVNEYYGFPGDLDIYGDGQFNFASGRNGPDSYAVNGNVTVKDNATILLFSYYAAVNGTLTVPMNQVLYTAGRSESSAGEWTMLNGVTENVSNYTNKYVKTEILANGALCFSDKKEGKTIYNTVPVKPFTMFGVKGGVAPYSYSATSLPSGLTIDAETGYISGTSTLGNKDVTVNFTVTDAMGREINADMSFVVKNPSLDVTKYGGSKPGYGETGSWTTIVSTSLDEGQILFVKSNFDLDETAIEVPKNIVLRDVNGKMLAGDIDLKDGVKYAFPYEVEAHSVSYTRNFTATQKDHWQSFYVPFSVDVEKYKDDFDIAEIFTICPMKDTNGDGNVDGADESFMIISRLNSGFTAPNTPYLIRPKNSGKQDIVADNAILKAAENGEVTFSTSRTMYTVVGIYEPTTLTPGDNNFYVTSTGGLSYRSTSPGTLNPNKWYMHAEAREYGNNNLGGADGSRAKTIQIVAIGEDLDEATAIKVVNGEVISSESNIYTINGVKINSLENAPAGIYIVNGKKIFKNK